jgi:cellulose synthase/poly-beta-1,6-N-acetylglucosamine synthase-like glycosyltransferase
VVIVEIVFWVALALLVYTHLGYPLLLRALSGRRPVPQEPPIPEHLPLVSLIVAAHDEQAVIADWVANARELDYPAEKLEVIVASDGSEDATAQLAREAGADIVVELTRGGKVAALNAAVERAGGQVLAFADANARWNADALKHLVARLAQPETGYVCGQIGFTSSGGANEEGLYWRYEMAVRSMESRLAGVTAGNGAINAVRREAYLFLEPTRGQDISFPFELTKRGWRAVYEPRARATESLAASIGDEFGRKRRMMAGAWNTILSTSLLSPRGYGPAYALEIYSHRLLRYASPVLHLVVLGTNLALVGEGWVYSVTLALQLALLAAAAFAGVVPFRPLQIARYYVAVTASSAVGLWDYLRRGVPRTWEKAGGTR